MSYYCKGEICQRSKECLRAESWRTFRGKENTEGLWFVHEPTCVRSDYEDGVFRSRDEGGYERFIEKQATLARMLKNNYL